jgi:hypothetical protein
MGWLRIWNPGLTVLLRPTSDEVDTAYAVISIE